MDNPYYLFAGDTHIGTLTETAWDQPVSYNDFEPTPAFAQYAEILEKSYALKHLEEVARLNLSLVYPDGGKLRLSMIIIEGRKARWRAGMVIRENNQS